MEKILIYGYGNPGRQDDGLGARFIELIDKWIEEVNMGHVSTDCNYQLNVEDSAVVAEYDTVIFVDASVVEEIAHFRLEKVIPDNARIEFTMHAVSTAYITDLCNKIYGKHPDAYVLHIKGYEFDFKEKLTEGAYKNMQFALDYLKDFLKERSAT